MSALYKIGYIDEDIRQVKLYKRKLREYGFEVIGYKFYKNMPLDNLMEQVYQSGIDLLMIDYKLNETNIIPFNGDVVETTIYENKPLFPHIIFTNKVDQAEPHVDDWKIIFDKEEIFTEGENDILRVKKFVTMLERSIQQYRNYVSKKKEELGKLLEKGINEGLNAAEKNEALVLQNELSNLDKTKIHEVPMQLVSVEKIENLSKTRKEAEEFLKALIEEE